MNKIKVCHISTVHQINDVRILYKEIQSLAKSNFQVIYLSKKDQPFIINENIEYRYLINKNNFLFRLLRIFQSFFICLNINARVYHIHDPELIFIGIILKILKKCVVIYDIHEIYKDSILHKPYLNKTIAKILSFAYGISEKILIKKFDHLILAETNYSKYYKTKNQTIIQNFIPSKYILSTKTINIKKNSEINFVYVGSISKVRGLNEMLELAKILKDNIKFKFHIIGVFYSRKLLDDFNLKLKINGLQKFFKIYGGLSFDRAQEILKKCDIGLNLLHPLDNYKISLPTKFFEYMANGLVLFMSDFEEWKEFNDKYYCGLTIDIFNIPKEKDKIISLLKNQKKLKKISENNLHTLKSDFIWENEENKLISLYQKLCDME